MDTEQSNLITDLYRGKITKTEFEKRFPGGISGSFFTEHIKSAYEQCNSEALEDILFLGFSFSLIGPEHCQIFCDLLFEPWHISHEDLAEALQDLRVESSIDSLYRAARCKYDYFTDDGEAFAIKCIWAIHDMDSLQSLEKLEIIANEEQRANVKEVAAELLLERQGNKEK